MIFSLSTRTISSISAIAQDVIFFFVFTDYVKILDIMKNMDIILSGLFHLKQRSHCFFELCFWKETVSRWKGQLESRRKKQKNNPEKSYNCSK